MPKTKENISCQKLLHIAITKSIECNSLLKTIEKNADIRDSNTVAMHLQMLSESLRLLKKEGIMSPIFNEIISLRNKKIAHILENETLEWIAKDKRKIQATLENVCSILKDEYNKRHKTSSVPTLRMFEKYGDNLYGDSTIRSMQVEALQNAFSLQNASFLQEGKETLPFVKTTFPIDLKQFVTPTSDKEKGLFNYTKNHEKLKEQVQEEIIKCLNDIADKFFPYNKENPYYEEQLFIKNLQNIKLQNANDIEQIKEKYCSLPTVEQGEIDFNFYINILNAQEQNKENTKKIRQKNLSKTALEYSLKNEIIKSFEKRYLSYQIKTINDIRKKFLRDIYTKIEQFQRVEKLLSPFCTQFSKLWDLSQTDFNYCGFEILAQYANILENDKSLEELIALIGRQNAQISHYEKQLRSKVVLKTQWQTYPAYKGQITGIKLSGDINSVLPTQIALLTRPLTKRLFKKKLVEKQLLSYEYANRFLHSEENHETEEVNVEVIDKKGPVILCIDTSGSMSGAGEKIAKSIAYVFAKSCIEQERNCYLISFSTTIETKDLSAIKEGGLRALIDFLSMSFNGGTDATPALNESIRMLTQKDFKNADVLVISDMVMKDFGKTLVKKINEQKEKKTKFYSIVIGDTGNKNVINCFNENWSYNTNNTNQPYTWQQLLLARNINN